MKRKEKSGARRFGSPLFVSVLFFALLLALLLNACAGSDGAGSDESGLSSGTTSGGDAAAGSDDSSLEDEEPAEEPEEIPPLPESGALTPLSWGSAYLPASFEGVNPRIAEGGRLALVFAGTTEERGLDLADGCEIAYTLTDKSGAVTEEGNASLDLTGLDELRGNGGLRGVAFAVKKEFERGEFGYLSLSFKDQKGKEFTVKDAEIYKGLQYLGVTPSLLDLRDIGVKTVFAKVSVTMTGKFQGTELSFTLRLNRWEGNTTPEQIAHCARLFFDCYPKMYARFGKQFGASTKVTLAIENEGYEIASTGGSEVHIHDQWLKDHRTDYDCLTHEFAHVIQNGWDGNFCQYSGFIERFADYCRYVYAYKNGYYNDSVWTLNTGKGENSLENSVRFLVWLDQFHSTKDADLIVRYFDVIYHKKYPSARWNDAWKEIFKGTDLAGKTGEEAFALYLKDEFSSADATARSRGGKSPLLKAYDTRAKLRDRKFA